MQMYAHLEQILKNIQHLNGQHVTGCDAASLYVRFAGPLSWSDSKIIFYFGPVKWLLIHRRSTMATCVYLYCRCFVDTATSGAASFCGHGDGLLCHITTSTL